MDNKIFNKKVDQLFQDWKRGDDSTRLADAVRTLYGIEGGFEVLTAKNKLRFIALMTHFRPVFYGEFLRKFSEYIEWLFEVVKSPAY